MIKLKPALYGIDLAEAEALMKTVGEPAYRAKQLLDWLYHKYITNFDDAKTLPAGLRAKLLETHDLSGLVFAEEYEGGRGDSHKFLFKTRDDRLLESVLISQMDRRTVCVSTQLGCKMGCVFCASGKGKFGRNLTAGEIVEQVTLIDKHIKQHVTNIVFMGMGEPLDNFEATMKALEILQAAWGFDMGGRRITVSTSGISPKIMDFVKRNEGRVRLSISLHSSIEEKRSELMPINKKFTLRGLLDTLHEVHDVLKRDITFEYTLIRDVNDSDEEARGVARIAAQLHAKVNLIPYNPIREMDFRTPEKTRINAFRNHLERKGVRVTVRQTAGREIDAACGQLRLDREKESG